MKSSFVPDFWGLKRNASLTYEVLLNTKTFNFDMDVHVLKQKSQHEKCLKSFSWMFWTTWCPLIAMKYVWNLSQHAIKCREIKLQTVLRSCSYLWTTFKFKQCLRKDFAVNHKNKLITIFLSYSDSQHEGKRNEQVFPQLWIRLSFGYKTVVMWVLGI